MDAKELMIGVWIRYGSRFGIVKGIKTDTCLILVSCNGNDELIWETFDNIESIPLTPEILEKNGFVNVYRGRYRFDDDKGSIVEVSTVNNKIKWVRLSKYDEDIEEQLSNCTFNDMHFVHELQNVLKLCNIDKKIVL